MTDQELRAALLTYQPLIEMTKGHRYRIRETVDAKWEWVDGCTSTLGHAAKPQLLNWAARLGAETGDPQAHIKARDKAAEGGTDIHTLIERHCRQLLGEEVGPEPQNISDEVLYSFAKWQTWANAVELQPIVVEVRIASFSHKCAGTLDFLGRIRGVRSIADWKSGGIWPEHHLQSAAYRSFVREMTGQTLPGVLVHVPRDGGDVSDEPATDNLDSGFEAFLSLLRYGRWLKNFKRSA